MEQKDNLRHSLRECEPGTAFAAFLLLAVILVGLLYLILAPKQAFSQEENRSLEKTPALTLENVADGSFMTAAENYVGDHFVLRKQFIELNTLSQLALGKRDIGSNFGKTPAEGGIYFGKENHLYEVLLPNKTGVFAGNVKSLAYFAEKCGAPFFILPVPSGSQSQPENLPFSAPNHNQREELAAIQKAMPESASVVDVFAELSGSTGEDYYYRTDHHWNSYGAYVGYRALMESMGLQARAQEEFTYEASPAPFYGTLYSKALSPFQAPDTLLLPHYKEELKLTQETGRQTHDGIYWREFLEQKDQYSTFLGGNHGVEVVRNPKGGQGKLLIIKDSFANSLVPYLSVDFSEIHIIDLRFYNQNIYDYLKENKIDRAAAVYSMKQLCEVSFAGKLAR